MESRVALSDKTNKIGGCKEAGIMQSLAILLWANVESCIEP